MAMTPAGLSAVIKAAIEAEYGGPPPNAYGIAELQKFCDAMGNAIVPYLQQNADVSPTALSATSLNNPAGQPVTGGLSTSAPETIQGLGSLL
jgi:hypothetical protein